MNNINKFTKVAGIAVAVLVGASASALAFPSFNSNTKTIRNDRGGYLIEYALRMKKLDRAGGQVRFAGSCDSACTMYLAMPGNRACISPGASFGFHLPYGSSARGNAVAARFMMKSYPGWVRNWIHSKGGLRSGIMTMDYAYASRFIRPCAAATQTADARSAKAPREVKLSATFKGAYAKAAPGGFFMAGR